VSEVRFGLCAETESGVRVGSATGHLDEVFIRINGQQQYLWRAVDLEATVIDILLHPHRDQRAAVGRRTIWCPTGWIWPAMS
jgi:hypothetical protein